MPMKGKGRGWIGTGGIAKELLVSVPTVRNLLVSGRIPIKYWRAPGEHTHLRADLAEWRKWVCRSAVGQMTPEARRSRMLWRRKATTSEGGQDE